MAALGLCTNHNYPQLFKVIYSLETRCDKKYPPIVIDTGGWGEVGMLFEIMNHQCNICYSDVHSKALVELNGLTNDVVIANS